MKPIQLFGAGTASKSLVACAQRRLNVYWEIQVDGDKANAVIYGTPGTELVTTLSAIIRGMRVVGTKLYVANAANITTLDSSLTATNLASGMSTTSGRVSMENNATQLTVVDGLYGYTVTLPSGAVTKILAAAFPNGAKTVAYVGGYTVVEKPNTAQFWVSALNDSTTWPATFFQSAYSSSENLVAVDSDHGVLILFGTNYLEYWSPNGALDFPFGAIQSAAQQWGLGAIYSRAKIDNGIAFLATNRQGEFQVMHLDLINSYAPRRISDSNIENIIAGLSTQSDATSLSYMIDGHPMYQLTFQADEVSLLYDFSTGIWSETQTGTDTTARHLGDLSTTFNNITYLSDYRNGNLYRVSGDVYTDNGETIKRQLISRHLGDGNYFSVDELFLDMNTGEGLQSGQGSDPEVMLEVSKDGGRTYGNQRLLKMHGVGQYDKRVIARRVANGRDVVLRLTMTDPIPFVLTREAATVTPGAG